VSWHVLVGWVVGVAGVDSWFTLVDSDVGEVELNPLALVLIRAGGVELLVSCKVAGTAAVVWIVATLRSTRPRLAWCCLLAVAAVQAVVAGSYLARMLVGGA
jgi:hypothetical protein